MNFFIDFYQKVFNHQVRPTTAGLVVNIKAAIFKINLPLPHSTFNHYFILINFTKLAKKT